MEDEIVISGTVTMSLEDYKKLYETASKYNKQHANDHRLLNEIIKTANDEGKAFYTDERCTYEIIARPHAPK